MLPFVMLPRPLQESNVIGKGGTAGFLGPAYDPYYFYQDPNGTIKLDDFTIAERRFAKSGWSGARRCCKKSKRDAGDGEGRRELCAGQLLPKSVQT